MRVSSHAGPLRVLRIRPSRLQLRDVMRDAATSVFNQPLRTLLTALGTIIGAAAFVATLGLSSTLSQQVSDSFDARRATEVVVSEKAPVLGKPLSLPPAAVQRAATIDGVMFAGRRALGREIPVQSDPKIGRARNVRLIGADPGAVAVMQPNIVSGQAFSEYHEDRASAVVLLPSPVAARLGVSSPGTAVFVRGRPFLVMGIFDDVGRRSEAMLAMVMPYSTASSVWRAADEQPESGDVLIESAPNAAAVVAQQAALALRPEDPTALKAVAPPGPESFRREVQGDITKITMLLSLVALAMGSVSIANSTTVTVMNRVPEIGLRRSVGARPIHIFGHLMLETTLLGIVASIVGSCLGIIVTAVVAVVNGWAPVIDPRSALLSSVAGALAGAIAGLLPARRAMKIEPVEALQR